MEEFDNLYRQTSHSSETISKSEKSQIVDFLKLNSQHHETIFLFIKLYQNKYDDNLDCYKSKTLKNGNIRINLENLPNQLQNIIHIYVNKLKIINN